MYNTKKDKERAVIRAKRWQNRSPFKTNGGGFKRRKVNPDTPPPRHIAAAILMGRH